MPFSSVSLSPDGSKPTYRRPSHRTDFQIAIICALPLEYDAASLLVDEFWDLDGKQYGRTTGDTNSYRNGRIGMHNVVLMLLPNMGKATVAGSAATLRTSYLNLRIAFLMGVCGGVPIIGTREALLGDVIIGEAIIQYDFGRQYPGKFVPKETTVATQSMPNKDIRTLLAYYKSDAGKSELRQNTARHLKALQDAANENHYENSFRFPGFSEDKLFAGKYRHMHRGRSPCDLCWDIIELYCDEAAQSSCAELKCDERELVPRQRLERKWHRGCEETQCPDIFIGRVASADTVMKSGDHRDQIAKRYNIIAFEMEGAGLWDEAPCIVVKGICDYADSHKNKIWQPYAAATAAAVVKAMLERYTLADHFQLSASSTGEIDSIAHSNDHTSTTSDSVHHSHIHPAKLQVTHLGRQNPSSASVPAITQPNRTQTLRDAILDFQRSLTDDQRRELQRIKEVPDADAVLVFTAELDSLNRNRKGRSIASRLYSVLQSVRDFSAVVETIDSTHLGIAPVLWGSVKLTMFVAAKFVTYYEALSKFFVDLGSFCPRWRDYQIFYSSSPQLQNALYCFYESLIRCCKRAVEATQRSWPAFIFNSSRELFEREFHLDADDIKRRSQYVKDAISVAKKEADYQNQQLQSKGLKDGSKKGKQISNFRRKRDRFDKMESWQAQSDERQARERKQQQLESLSTHDYLTPFKQSRQKRYSGTLEWLFRTQEFDQWINSGDVPLLWCTGKIGSGKTILTASVIDKLLTEKRSSDVSISISFFFIRFDDRQSLNAEIILKSIARQILSSPGLSEEVETLLEQMRLNYASGLKEISEFLLRIVAAFKTLYIIIDGLDECARQDRHDLLEVLSSVVNVRPNTKLFLAGRDSVSREVRRQFSALNQLSMDCSSAQSDITTYVEGIVQEKLQNEELIVGDPNLIEDIKIALLDGANGMFLWVVFQVDELILQHCDDDIRKTIRNFPKDLKETFGRVIDRIVSRGSENTAKQIFRWIAAAKEPLSLDQLKEVIFIEIGQQYSKTDRQFNGIDRISSWCENLVHVDEELNTAQFVHQTVQQYFFEKSSDARQNQFYLNLEDADHYLGEICLTYLNFNDFKTTLARRQQPLLPMPPVAMAKTALRSQWKAAASLSTLWKFDLDIRGGSVAANAVETIASFQRDDAGDAQESLHAEHPFMKYASLHWILHTTMFQKGKSMTWNLWGKMILEEHALAKKPWNEESFSSNISFILEWSCKVRHYALIRLILLVGILSATDRGHIMQNAAREGDITMLDIVLEGEEPGYAIDQACLAAIRGGRPDAVERLLAAGADGQTALQAAAETGHQEIIKALLAAGADGQTTLRAAARRGHQDIIKALLAAGVDGPSALRAAARAGDQDVIKTLLAAGVNGQLALQVAAKKGYQDVVKTLLAAGVDGQLALRDAAKKGYHDIIETLLAAGVDGQTALLAIMTDDHLDGLPIRSLLAAGVSGLTALKDALTRGYRDGIESLLAADIDAQILSQAAAEGGHLHVIKSLSAAGIDHQAILLAISRCDDLGIVQSIVAASVDGTLMRFDVHAAMRAACRDANADIVGILLAAGVDASYEALSIASQYGHLDIVEKLLVAGAEVNARHSSYNLTALTAAAAGGYLDIVERLLAAGAEVNARHSSYDLTALAAAAAAGYLDIVERLLAAGANVNARHSSYNLTALTAAAAAGYLDIVKRLLAAGANVNTGDKVALRAAAKNGHLEIVSLLEQEREIDRDYLH